jgi:hypothetical protein
MDEAFRPFSAGRPSRLAMHYLHERHHAGTPERGLGVAHYPNLLSVPSPFFFSSALLTRLLSSYFSIFIVYTPYTIYQCMLHLFGCGRFLTPNR